MSMLSRAIILATQYHDGQVDKAGLPYIFHPLAVAGECTTEDQQVVAVLHDIVEDTHCTLPELRFHFPEHIVDAVDAITYREGEGRINYYLRLRQNRLAKSVKLHDVRHNLREDRLGKLDAETRTRLRVKYATALEVISA